MTAANPALSLDPAFPCLSAESADPHSISLGQQIEEIARELHQRRNAYPRRVQQGLMTRYDAERQIDILHAIEDDLRFEAELAHWSKSAPVGAVMPPDMVQRRDKKSDILGRWRWSDLVNELRREIILRRRFYRAWIDKGSLDPVRARHQLERFEAVHCRYWVDMAHFMPDELWQHRAAIAQHDGPERAAFRMAIRAHRARFTPGTTRAEYATAPAATAAEPELVFA